MLKPLEQYYCDTCGEIIESVDEGYVEWISGNEDPENNKSKYSIHSFRIIHDGSISPLKPKDRNGCFKFNRTYGQSSVSLNTFFNPDTKYLYLNYMLHPGKFSYPDLDQTLVRSITEYVEFIKRLTIPYYEQGRLFFQKALEDELIERTDEYNLHKPEFLKWLIDRYEN